MTINTIDWDQSIIERYDIKGPRYTSYPSALAFTPTINPYKPDKLVNRFQSKQLSLYLHIPFCASICYYCACNKVITKDKTKADRYLNFLYQEMQLYQDLCKHQTITQLHWGGGTPTFLSSAQLFDCLEKLNQYFTISANADCAIEIDPRTITKKDLTALSNYGFNRLSFGIQDFNPAVQKAVNRIQTFRQTQDLVNIANQLGFKGINMDLIYGLPMQSLESFGQTLEQIALLRPNRISLFNYAHMPEQFLPQRRINKTELPSAREKLEILYLSINFLLAEGYEYIGMDHFALPDDDLTKAQRMGSLCRNFQGYATDKDADLLGLGVSAISSFGECYFQNAKSLEAYYQSLKNQVLPIDKVFALSKEDVLRRSIIQQIICYFHLDLELIEQTYGIVFERHFANEMSQLKAMAQDGLLNIGDQRLTITAKGRLLVRTVCMVFDQYSNNNKEGRYSKVI